MLKIHFLLILKILFLINAQNSSDIFEQNKNVRFCGADLKDHEIIISSKISKKRQINPSRKLSTNYEPIRIILDTTYLEDQGNEILSLKDKIPMIKEAMNKSVKALSDILEVERYGNDIFVDLNETLFNKYKIYKWNPIFNNSDDIPADLIILTKFEEIGEFPQGVLASAMPLVLYKETNRPIVGLLTVSRSPSFYSYTHVKEYFSFVFLHELTHVLGFLQAMFPFISYFIREDILTYKVIRGLNRTLIKTPKVVERAKKYFNCNTLEGLELEDQGGQGSAISHWEQRILLGEYMGAVIYQEEMAISEFTLAFLEDTTWYKTKYYTGGLFRFGKNKGCEFIENDCLDQNLKSRFKNEFFDGDNPWYGSCSTGRQSRTYGTIFNYNYIENIYNRLGDYEGGSIYTTDYCPTNGQRIDESGLNYFFGSCKYGSPYFGLYIYYINEDNNILENGHRNSELPKEISEKISDNSFCMMTNLVPKGKYKLYNTVFHPMCYETYCSSKSLTIKINDLFVVCPRKGGNVEVEGFDGYINCPDYNLICTGTVLCNDIFDCIDKKSELKNESLYYEYDSETFLQNSDLLELEATKGFEMSDDGKCPFNSSSCPAKSENTEEEKEEEEEENKDNKGNNEEEENKDNKGNNEEKENKDNKGNKKK